MYALRFWLWMCDIMFTGFTVGVRLFCFWALQFGLAWGLGLHGAVFDGLLRKELRCMIST